MQRQYQLGEPLYRQQQYWERRGIFLNRTSLANWKIKGALWFDPVIRRLKYHAFLEPVLNADETPTRVLEKNGEPVNKKGQMWVICTGASASNAAVMSIIETAKRNKLDVYGYLTHLLTVLPE